MRDRSQGFAASIFLLCVHLSAWEAAAQAGPYVGGSGFAEIKRFGSASGAYPGAGEEFSLDGTGAGGGLRVGTFLHQRVSLELAIDAGTTTTADVPAPYVILAIYAPVAIMKASAQFLSVSTVLGYHPPARGRLRLGYLAGFSFVRGTYETDYPSYSLPLAIFSESGSARPTSLSQIDPTTYPPPNFTIGTLTQRELTTGAILGLEAAIGVTTRLAVVPEVRALAFSTPNNGPDVFLIRPGVGLRWSF